MLVIGLPLIKALFKEDFCNSLPGDALQIKGDMLVMRWLLHSIEEGTAWMITSKMNLMMSVLLVDGRYEERVFIVPITITPLIKEDAFIIFCLYMKILRPKAAKGDSDDETYRNANIDDIITQKHGKDLNSIQVQYLNGMNYLAEHVVNGY